MLHCSDDEFNVDMATTNSSYVLLSGAEKDTLAENNKISEYVDEYNAKAIYITQIQHDGLKNEPLFFANEIVKKFCRKNGYNLIPLDEIALMTEGDFYDPWHTTLVGTKKITNYLKPLIISEIKKMFEEL